MEWLTQKYLNMVDDGPYLIECPPHARIPSLRRVFRGTRRPCVIHGTPLAVHDPLP
jgi:hypothetical protein